MLLITEEKTKNRVGVIDTDDFVIEYVGKREVIEIMQSGIKMGNVPDLKEYTDCLNRGKNEPKILSIYGITDIVFAPFDAFHSEMILPGGLQFRSDFMKSNKNLGLVVKFIKTGEQGVRFDVPYKGVYHRIQSCDRKGFMYNGQYIESALHLRQNTLSFIGYDTVYNRCYLAYTDGDCHEHIMFEDYGIRYSHRDKGGSTARSEQRNVPIQAFKRLILTD